MGLYAVVVVLLHVPPVQCFIGQKTAAALADKLGTKVEVGYVNLGILNRLIIDDICIYDQQGDSMVCATRASVKVDYMPLTQGRISIASAQLFGLKAKLYKLTAHSEPNYQFMLDSLASKDTTSKTPLDLHIGSLIVRNGNVAYDQRDISPTPGIFSPKHIQVSGLSAHVILRHATDNTLSLQLKNLSFREERAGLCVQSLRFDLEADHNKATLPYLSLSLPSSVLELENVEASYSWKGKGPDTNTLRYKGNIKQSKITLSDIASFIPSLKDFNEAIYLSMNVCGTASSLQCKGVSLRTGSGSINLQADGEANFRRKTWHLQLDNLNLTQQGIACIAQGLGRRKDIPVPLTRAGTLHLTGEAKGNRQHIEVKANAETDAGNLELKATKNGQNITASAVVKDVDLGHLLDNNKLGKATARLHIGGTKEHLKAKATIDAFDFNGHTFQDISIDGLYTPKSVSGKASIHDAKANIDLHGLYAFSTHKYDLQANISYLQPSLLGIKTADKAFVLTGTHLSANNMNRDGHLDVEAPFMNLYLRGQYDPATLYAAITNIVADKLPTLPGLKRRTTTQHNDFTLQANITSVSVLKRLFGIDIATETPVHINGNISETNNELNLYVTAPDLNYAGKHFHDISVEINTIGDSLLANAQLRQGLPGELTPEYSLRAAAADNTLSTLLCYDNHSRKLPIKGVIDAKTQFSKTTQGANAARIDINPSQIMLGETKWNVLPAEITYTKNELDVNMLSLAHGGQHITINGKASKNRQDSIVADLNDVDVAYILDLVNFHSVDFAGNASGKAIVKSIFDKPDAYANLDVEHFTFEQGPLGTLHANVTYDNNEGRINILAQANDGPQHMTYIDGYVSPRKNYIDLGITANGTSLKFMESFCGSFMDNVEAYCNGKMSVVGDLSDINLVGDITAHGQMHMKQLGTTYTFNRLRAHAVPDDIQIVGDSIYDKDFGGHSAKRNASHYALVSGDIHHQHLTRLSFDINVDAHNFLGFDTRTFGENTFYGTVLATGKVDIHGKSGQTIINIDAQPAPGSTFVYNVATPDAISDKSFIHWHDATPYIYRPTNDVQANREEENNISSDIIINFLVNTTPNLTLKLIMDEQTGDYITLNGNGVIRANYFNKGGLDMFGNYTVNSGLYKLTIQNLIKKEFEFVPGGTIAFGGDPYNAPLNLQAKYTVTGVPLSDLNIGKSFSANNIRVDCLMGITGTPGAPKVDFTMDLPTVNNDAKQMVYSVINSQEEMNQQVLYLLAIGRFYAQTKNNQRSEETAEQQSQTSLAMQSFLSGTISQQINQVLSKVVNSKNWSFGANISTGDEGFFNAEYEGILNGRLLNNRLLFNGQFGYRDKANTTQSFIGDFDLRYLIFPNGNLSVHVYNQANDRYFTRNSLNTQGLGIIMKKDFNNLYDLFGIKRKKKAEKKTEKKKAKKDKAKGDGKNDE